MKALPSLIAEQDSVTDLVFNQSETLHEYWTAVWRSAVAHCCQIRHLMENQTNNDPIFTAQCNALPQSPILHEVIFPI